MFSELPDTCVCPISHPVCDSVENDNFTEVYFILVGLIEVVEISVEKLVTHSFVGHRYVFLHVLHVLDDDVVIQPCCVRLQTTVQSLVEVGAMFPHTIQDHWHQCLPLIIQSAE